MSEAQKTARLRNWRIRSLRAIYAQCYTLTPENRAIAQAAIDADLVLAGADTAAQHAEKVRASFDKAYVEDEDIPF